MYFMADFVAYNAIKGLVKRKVKIKRPFGGGDYLGFRWVKARQLGNSIVDLKPSLKRDLDTYSILSQDKGNKIAKSNLVRKKEAQLLADKLAQTKNTIKPDDQSKKLFPITKGDKINYPAENIPKGSFVRVFGFTPASKRYPVYWNVGTPSKPLKALNTSPSAYTAKGKAHYINVTSPEFTITRSGSYTTSGFNTPKGQKAIPSKVTSAKELQLNSEGGKKTKTPYAYFLGNVQDYGVLKSLDEVPSIKKAYKVDEFRGTVRLKKQPVSELLKGKSDYFYDTNSGRKLVGKKEYSTLTKTQKEKVLVVNELLGLPNADLYWR